MSNTQTASPTWRKEDKYDSARTVRIYTENSETAERTLIYVEAQRYELFRAAPNAERYVDVDTGDVILPSADCGVEDETLCQVIQSIISTPEASAKPTLSVEEHPRAYIEMHVVLVLLGLAKEAQVLQERLWLLFGRYELTMDVVLWIWETFGESIDRLHEQNLSIGPYIPPYSEFYVQVTAWHVLNMAVEDKLNSAIGDYVWGDGFFSQPRLKQVIEERHKVYGLEQGFEMAYDMVTPEGRLPQQPHTPSKAAAQHPSTGREPLAETKQQGRAPVSTPIASFKYDRANSGLDPNATRWEVNNRKALMKREESESPEPQRPMTPISPLDPPTIANGVNGVNGFKSRVIDSTATFGNSTHARTHAQSQNFGLNPFNQAPNKSQKRGPTPSVNTASSSPTTNPFGKALKHKPSSEFAPPFAPASHVNMRGQSNGFHSGFGSVGPSNPFGASTAALTPQVQQKPSPMETSFASSNVTNSSAAPLWAFQNVPNNGPATQFSNDLPPAFGRAPNAGFGFGAPPNKATGQNGMGFGTAALAGHASNGFKTSTPIGQVGAEFGAQARNGMGFGGPAHTGQNCMGFGAPTPNVQSVFGSGTAPNNNPGGFAPPARPVTPNNGADTANNSFNFSFNSGPAFNTAAPPGNNPFGFQASGSGNVSTGTAGSPSRPTNMRRIASARGRLGKRR